MPLVTFEYTSNIELERLQVFLGELHEEVAAMIETPVTSCKARIIVHDKFVIGNLEANQGYILLTLEILSGRDESTKQKVLQHVAQRLQELIKRVEIPSKIQVSVHLKEIQKEFYYISV